MISEEYLALLQQAAAQKEKAYAPYSHFAVGAAILSKSGKVFGGCNVENASYGLTRCAEQGAVLAAVAAGEREFQAIAVVSDAERVPYPCGACLQILAEFAPNIQVIVGNRDGGYRQMTLTELLPHAFVLKTE